MKDYIKNSSKQNKKTITDTRTLSQRIYSKSKRKQMLMAGIAIFMLFVTSLSALLIINKQKKNYSTRPTDSLAYDEDTPCTVRFRVIASGDDLVIVDSNPISGTIFSTPNGDVPTTNITVNTQSNAVKSVQLTFDITAPGTPSVSWMDLSGISVVANISQISTNNYRLQILMTPSDLANPSFTLNGDVVKLDFEAIDGVVTMQMVEAESFAINQSDQDILAEVPDMFFEVVTTAGCIPSNGDINGVDGVDGVDYSILRDEYSPYTEVDSPADLNCDNYVDAIDYNILKDNYFL